MSSAVQTAVANAQTDQPDSSGWSASLYNKTASFVYSKAFTTPVVDLLQPQPGERIIDFGCGSGEVTLELEKIVEQKEGGVVVGVDFSESMVDQAKKNGLKHAFVSDIQDIQIPNDVQPAQERFDAVFSNAALHWCNRDPAGVLESAKKVLKPGGRLAVEMGGFMNCVGVRSALHHVLKSKGHDPKKLDPWYFPSVAEYENLLVQANFKSTHISLNPRFTHLSNGGLEGWLHLFARSSFLKDFSDEGAKEVIDEVVELCRRDCQDGQGNWAMMYMRLRFTAVLEA